MIIIGVDFHPEFQQIRCFSSMLKVQSSLRCSCHQGCVERTHLLRKLTID